MSADEAFTPSPVETVTIPKAALDWLFGAAPNHEGKWFGDCEEDETPRGSIFPRPRYWWRSHFRKLIKDSGYD